MAEDLRFIITVKDDGTAVVKKFGKATEKVAKQTKSSGRKMSKAFKSTNVSIKGALKSIFSLRTAILAIGTGLVLRSVFKLTKSVLQAGDVIERAGIRLRAMKGSVEDASRAFALFQDIAGRVPFTLESVIEAGVTLEAFGANSEETLEAVTDLAAFMGTDLVFAAQSFGRAFAAGAGAADVLRERGVLATIQLRTGVDDLTKLSLPALRKALIEAMVDPLGPIAGQTKELAKTFQGQVSIMEDSLFKFRQAIAESGVTEFAKDTIRDFTIISNTLLDAFNAGIVDDFGNSIKSITPAADEVVRVLFNMRIGFLELKKIFVGLREKPFGFDPLIPLDPAVALRRELSEGTKELQKQIDNLEKISELAESRARAEAEINITAARLETRRNSLLVITQELLASGLLTKEREKTIFADLLKEEKNILELEERRLELSKLILSDQIVFGEITESNLDKFNETVDAFDLASDKLKEQILGAKELGVTQEKINETLRQRAEEEALRKRIVPEITRITAEIKADEDAVTRFKELREERTTIIEAVDAKLLEAGIKADEDRRAEFELELQQANLRGESLLAVAKKFIDAETRLNQRRKKASLQAAASLFGGLASLSAVAGDKLFAVNKAFALGEAVTQGVLAVQKTLASLPFPASVIAAAGVAAQAAANVAIIATSKPGSANLGGLSGGGAGGGGGGNQPIALRGLDVSDEIPEQLRTLEVNIVVNGFVGEEAELATKLGDIFREAVGDNVDFGLQTTGAK